MDFVYNMSGGLCQLENSPIESKLQHQVWPSVAQRQNFAYTSVDVASPQSHNCDVQASTSDSSYSESASEAEWDALLFGPTRSVDTPISVQSTSSVESKVEIRPQKRHYAHITFVPSIDGLKPVVSRKRKRTAFTTEQVAALEEVFQHKPYVTREERGVLVQRLAVSDQAIKVWFQNRRLKHKKEIEEELEAAQVYPEYNMFAHTELLLHRVDKDGCVALNQQSIDELVSAIDALLPKDLDLTQLCYSNTPEEDQEGSTYSEIIHEPISPPEVGAELTTSCTPEWWNLQVIDPKQSLQRLLDVHRSL